jgi:hypothetical protein
MAAVLSGGSAGLPPCCCCGASKPVQGRADTCTDWLMASKHLQVASVLAVRELRQSEEACGTSVSWFRLYITATKVCASASMVNGDCGHMQRLKRSCFKSQSEPWLPASICDCAAQRDVDVEGSETAESGLDTHCCTSSCRGCTPPAARGACTTSSSPPFPRLTTSAELRGTATCPRRRCHF